MGSPPAPPLFLGPPFFFSIRPGLEAIHRPLGPLGYHTIIIIIDTIVVERGWRGDGGVLGLKIISPLIGRDRSSPT
jgi:hypothetical protein